MCRGALRPSCPPSELPPRARLNRPVPPPSCVRVYAPALPPPCTRRPRAPAARARVGARPSLPPAATRHLPGRGCLSLTRGLDTGSPPRSPGPRTTSLVGPPPGLHTRAGTFARPAGVPHGHVPAGGHTRCGRRRRASAPRASFRRSSPLPTAPSACRGSPPSGADPFSWSPTSAPHGALEPGTLLRGNLKERLVREDECLPRHLSGLLLCAGCFSPIHRLQWPRVRV